MIRIRRGRSGCRICTCTMSRPVSGMTLGNLWLLPALTANSGADLHPRSSRDGHKVAIDSSHARSGRQMYLLDVSPVVG